MVEKAFDWFSSEFGILYKLCFLLRNFIQNAKDQGYNNDEKDQIGQIRQIKTTNGNPWLKTLFSCNDIPAPIFKQNLSNSYYQLKQK